jgi:hypothetical protein
VEVGCVTAAAAFAGGFAALDAARVLAVWGAAMTTPMVLRRQPAAMTVPATFLTESFKNVLRLVLSKDVTQGDDLAVARRGPQCPWRN